MAGLHAPLRATGDAPALLGNVGAVRLTTAGGRTQARRHRERLPYSSGIQSVLGTDGRAGAAVSPLMAVLLAACDLGFAR